MSWAKVRSAIERGKVSVNGVIATDPGADVLSTAVVDFDVNRPAMRPARSRFGRLYEDTHILVIDKPAGLLTIPVDKDGGGDEDTVLSRVREYMDRRRGPGGYVGTLHRLDRDTSGALALALTREAHDAGRAQFGRHEFTRQYMALVEGVPTPAIGTIDAAIAAGYTAGRRRLARPGEPGIAAVTHYVVRQAYGGRAAAVELRLDTGRQHQIRLHLQHIGHPVLGDRVYGTPSGADAAARQMLHAWTLAFPHPMTGARVSVEAAPPDDFVRMRARMRGWR